MILQKNNKRYYQFIKKYQLIILMCNLLFTLNVVPQVREEWIAKYNGFGNGVDYAEAMVVDISGNVYVTGYSAGLESLYDYATIKYNSVGEEQWAVRYNGSGNKEDYANSIIVADSGDVYVTGSSVGKDSSYDYVTIKYSISGEEQWVARYNGTGNAEDRVRSISMDSAGNVYVTGRSYGLGTDYDYLTIKYNGAGEEQWIARYNGTDNSTDSAYDIVIGAKDDIYVTGYSIGAGTLEDCVTIKYNYNGEEQWTARYNGPANDMDGAVDIAIDNSDNVYITGFSFGGDETMFNCVTIKYNNAGEEQWVARYSGSGYDTEARAIAIDNSCNVYITGRSDNIETDDDYVTIKYNNMGKEQWVKRYSSLGYYIDRACSICVDKLGNSYVTGYSPGPGTSFDYVTIKYDSAGEEKWILRYNGLGNMQDFATDIAIDDCGNIFVTGASDNLGIYPFNYEYATIKYSQQTFSEMFYFY